MIDDKRIRKRNLVTWDIRVEADDLKALDFLPALEKGIGTTPITIVQDKRKDKDSCNDCEYKRAIEEILNVLALCKLVKLSNENQEDEGKSKGYRIEVK